MEPAGKDFALFTSLACAWWGSAYLIFRPLLQYLVLPILVRGLDVVIETSSQPLRQADGLSCTEDDDDPSLPPIQAEHHAQARYTRPQTQPSARGVPSNLGQHSLSAQRHRVVEIAGCAAGWLIAGFPLWGWGWGRRSWKCVVRWGFNKCFCRSRIQLPGVDAFAVRAQQPAASMVCLADALAGNAHPRLVVMTDHPFRWRPRLSCFPGFHWKLEKRFFSRAEFTIWLRSRIGVALQLQQRTELLYIDHKSNIGG